MRMRKKHGYRGVSPALAALLIILCTACGRADAGTAANDAKESAADRIQETAKAENAPAAAGTETENTGGETDKGGPNTDSAETPEREEEDMGEKATLLYQGHASVRITTAEGKTIYVDPYMGEGYDAPADLILVTHGHRDHTQTDLIGTKNADCRTITWKEALSGGQHQNYDFGYVQVEAVEAGYNSNHDVTQCVGYILTFSGGVTLYLSGDTSTTPQMKEFAERDLDYAFFCCDGIYNMDVTEAIECARLVGAKHSIPYHMVPGSVGGFDRQVAESFDVPDRIILKPGEELILK